LFRQGSVADLGSGIRCLVDPWIPDPGWVKIQDTDPRSGSRANNPDHISESLETFLEVKILKFFERPGIREGSG
jgi:hypothetical protein